jgi:hypothetical protein
MRWDRLAILPLVIIGAAYLMNEPGGGRTPVEQTTTSPPKKIFTNRDRDALVRISRENEILFNRDYKGHLFVDTVRFQRASEKIIGSGYQIQFEGAYCFISDKAVLAEIAEFPKGQLVKLKGTIKTTMFGDLTLSDCSIE